MATSSASVAKYPAPERLPDPCPTCGEREMLMARDLDGNELIMFCAACQEREEAELEGYGLSGETAAQTIARVVSYGARKRSARNHHLGFLCGLLGVVDDAARGYLENHELPCACPGCRSDRRRDCRRIAEELAGLVWAVGNVVSAIEGLTVPVLDRSRSLELLLRDGTHGDALRMLVEWSDEIDGMYEREDEPAAEVADEPTAVVAGS